MAGMRVHELAKEFGMTSKELVERLKEMKIPVKNHASTLVDAYVDKIRKELGPELQKRTEEAQEDKGKDAAAEEQVSAEEEERKRLEEEHKQAAQAEIKRRQKEQKRREAAEAEAKAASQQEVEEVVEEPKPSKPSVFDGLLSQIAAESNRLTQEKKEADEARAAAAAQASAEPAQADSPYREKGAKKKKKARQQVEVDSESEDDRYRQMAQAVEQLQRDKVLEEARAAVAEAEKQSTGRRKKRKERRAAEAAKKAEEEAQRKAEITGVPVGVVQVTSGITVGELADALEVPGNEVVKRLFLLGTPLTLTQSMSDDLVELIAGDIGREVKIISPEEEMSFTFYDDEKDLKPRPPVVTVMGHVDHGKTSLLDAIRHSGVQQAEAGGITQAIGASVVWINGNQITFIDTPGHEAFTAMRARGAQVTDIIVLVVAADDGVMPQTIEAIDHAKAADVPIVVAINKIDKPGANPDRVKSELAERGVVPEEWGGNNMFVEVSARQNLNIDELLETIILQAEVLELKANPDTTASGFVIEANLDKGRGPVATVIVQRGTLRVGDALVAGVCFGHVRALIDPKGNSVKEAKPADPVEILGLSSVPSAGDEFAVFENESEARSLAAERELKQRLAAQEAPRHMNLDDLFARIEANKHAELNLIVKADTQGSIEALRGALEKMDQSEVRINVIRAAVGGVTETDVNFAAASDAIIIGFGVRPQAGVRQAAEREKVDIRLYRVIYQAIEDINAARVGLLAPEEVEVDTGSATVRETFKMPKVGVIAGCIVTEGEIANTDHVRIVRDGVIVHDGSIMSMRHYRDDVSSVRSGTECGIGIEDFQDIKEGDVIEGYRIEQVARKE
ncbi:MAG TPA: translation initiation factor IF-2 [Coriobacteriaceae bacterium]|nr:translation initiation factor IF-2 [Coriobacteriaceae bacterium]